MARVLLSFETFHARVAAALLLGAVVLGGCSEARSGPKGPGSTGGSDGIGGDGGSGPGGGTSLDPCLDVECQAGAECFAENDAGVCYCVEASCTGSVFCSPEACDKNATCSERPGGFACSCKSGFFGNGFTCVEDALCQGVSCEGANQKCVSDGVVASCVCRDGFELVAGSDCEDINECNTVGCPFGSECTNFPGGYACDCPYGYALSSTGCESIDFCAGGVDDCDKLGMSCALSVGELGCECSSSQVSGATFCKATAACSPSTCKNGGDCVETSTGYQCFCPTGTSGPTCTDTTTCALSRSINDGPNPLIGDPSLRKSLEYAAGVFDGSTVTIGDLQFVTALEVVRLESDPAVTSLDGLECFPRLQEIYFGDHNISDLSPLADLKALQVLDLSCNPVTNIGPIVDRLGLRELRLAQRANCDGAKATLSAPSSLASLKNLRSLDLTGQALASDPGFSNLPYLRELILDDNPIDAVADVGTLLVLETLRASATGTKSLAGLAKFPRLRTLNVSSSGVTSLAGLSGGSEIRSLSLNDLGLASLAGIDALPKLSALSASGNEITSAAPLANAPSLRIVSLSSNSIATLTDLAKASNPKLEGLLQLSGNPLNCAKLSVDLVALEDNGIFVTSDCP